MISSRDAEAALSPVLLRGLKALEASGGNPVAIVVAFLDKEGMGQVVGISDSTEPLAQEFESEFKALLQHQLGKYLADEA